MSKHRKILLGVLLGMTACQSSAPAAPGHGLSFSLADADKWRVLFVDSSTNPLPVNMANQLRPHLQAMMQRLDDTQVIQMAMKSSDGSHGAYLASVAATPIEHSYAKVLDLAVRKMPTEAAAESLHLLRLLGEYELSHAGRPLGGSPLRGENARQQVPDSQGVPVSPVVAQPTEQSRRLAQLTDRVAVCAKRAREAAEALQDTKQRYDAMASAVERALQLSSSSANMERLQEIVQRGKVVELELRARKDESAAAEGDLAKARKDLVEFDGPPAKPPIAAATDKSPAAMVKSGQALHARILDMHPTVDRFYRKATLWGAMTDQSLAVISIPSVDWQALSQDERDSLAAYAASLVDAVRSSPFEFTDIPTSAPLAPTIRKSAAAMTSRSWGIIMGAISPDGRDIMSDDMAIKGQ